MKYLILAIAVYFSFQFGRVYDKPANTVEDIRVIESTEEYREDEPKSFYIWLDNAQYMYENGKITLIQIWED